MIHQVLSFCVALFLLAANVQGFFLGTTSNQLVPWNNRLVDQEERALVAPTSTSLYLAKKKKKESMAEKRARRQAKQQRQLDAPPPLEVPVTALTLEEEPDEASTPDATTQPTATTTTQQQPSDADVVKTKAQELLDRQKESISVLTTVREAIEAIDPATLTKALDHEGYYVVDNFVQNPSLVTSMQQEAPALYESNLTSLDTDNTLCFAGEFLTPLQGGEAQYQLAPRSIEWIVGATKYMPHRIPGLDSGNCMGFLRTFDRSARQAARQLFLGEEGRDSITEGSSAAAAEDEPVVLPPSVEAPDESDQRTITLRYYLVDEEWDTTAAGSGGIVFGTDKVDAQANRLVIYKSKETVVQKEAWFMGNQDKAYCIELHLIRETAAPS